MARTRKHHCRIQSKGSFNPSIVHGKQCARRCVVCYMSQGLLPQTPRSRNADFDPIAIYPSTPHRSAESCDNLNERLAAPRDYSCAPHYRDYARMAETSIISHALAALVDIMIRRKEPMDTWMEARGRRADIDEILRTSSRRFCRRGAAKGGQTSSRLSSVSRRLGGTPQTD